MLLTLKSINFTSKVLDGVEKNTNAKDMVPGRALHFK